MIVWMERVDLLCIHSVSRRIEGHAEREKGKAQRFYVITGALQGAKPCKIQLQEGEADNLLEVKKVRARQVEKIGIKLARGECTIWGACTCSRHGAFIQGNGSTVYGTIHSVASYMVWRVAIQYHSKMLAATAQESTCISLV
jgi:hypothetical protein